MPVSAFEGGFQGLKVRSKSSPLVAVLLLGFCCSGDVAAAGEGGRVDPRYRARHRGGDGGRAGDPEGKGARLVPGPATSDRDQRADPGHRRRPDYPARDVTLVDDGDHTKIMAGGRLVLALFDVDAEVEGVERKILAYTVKLRLQEV